MTLHEWHVIVPGIVAVTAFLEAVLAASKSKLISHQTKRVFATVLQVAQFEESIVTLAIMLHIL